MNDKELSWLGLHWTRFFYKTNKNDPKIKAVEYLTWLKNKKIHKSKYSTINIHVNISVIEVVNRGLPIIVWSLTIFCEKNIKLVTKIQYKINLKLKFS